MQQRFNSRENTWEREGYIIIHIYIITGKLRFRKTVLCLAICPFAHSNHCFRWAVRGMRLTVHLHSDGKITSAWLNGLRIPKTHCGWLVRGKVFFKFKPSSNDKVCGQRKTEVDRLPLSCKHRERKTIDHFLGLKPDLEQQVIRTRKVPQLVSPIAAKVRICVHRVCSKLSLAFIK